ncbi:aminoacyl-tRNA hydrolase [candidate division WWE3 bacterium RIFCSPHIGHO2_01_FULL_43_9]|uniref:Peptidyl-tRNA hydrolase n=1 Tax=candidate division WWE3 bacterium RIFCSPHIGHO2_01_FULL_43_9 TaxID=1802618 RepID=A0A1F4V6Q7_UNCKA|nr:MAG: aminoacyl-tRNA hydrolase [candidate division WWE3 bacterium RIFCSPHIGHO2_01_FULL_43_9]
MVIVGLGNPGKRYATTRHNVGFILVDALAKKLGARWQFNDKLTAYLARSTEKDILLVKPHTFVNASGSAVSAVLHYYKMPCDQLVVVHDDVDLPPFELKDSVDSSSAGHHGVEDIIEKLGSQAFRRIRVGIGRPVEKSFDVENYVLASFAGSDLDTLRKTGLEHLLSSLGI